MSVKTLWNPAQLLSWETRERIKALGVSLDEYTANIETKLRDLGEDELANTMLREAEQTVAEYRESKESQPAVARRRFGKPA